MDCHSYCIAERDPLAQAECKKDCCVGDKQVCTPGRMDAGAAVAAAKNAASFGLPPVALIDADKYFVPVRADKGEFKLFNVGGAKGTYELSSPDGAIVFERTKQKLTIELGAQGEPNSSMVIQLNTTNKFQTESRIRIASATSDEILIYIGKL